MSATLEELAHRFGMLQHSGLWLEVGWKRKDEVTAHVLEAESFGSLPAEIQMLIRRGELDVAGGGSGTLQNPVDWGDFTAIDAVLNDVDLEELDAAGLERLDAALATVGRGYGDTQRVETIHSESLEANVSHVSDDDEGWVGV